MDTVLFLLGSLAFDDLVPKLLVLVPGHRPGVGARSLEITIDTRLTSFSTVCVGRADDILGTRVPAGK